MQTSIKKEIIKQIKKTEFVTVNRCNFCGKTEEGTHYIITTIENKNYICCLSDYKFALNTYFIKE